MLRTVCEYAFAVVSRLTGITILVAATYLAPATQAQAQQAQPALDARVVVVGEGSVNVTPDHAQIDSGVSTRAKTVKEATEANAKLMTVITSTLLESGVAQRDIQTSRFSIQPVYAPQEPRSEPKLSGYAVSNHVRVTIRQIDKIGEILDRLVSAGATDVGGVAFLVTDPSKALDEARKAAVADARRKALVYAQASDLKLGPVLWITEDAGLAPPIMLRAQAAPVARMSSVPIEAGEDTFRARVTVGFDIAH